MINFSAPFYYIEDLLTINDSKLTLREIDVAACLISGKTNKTNASLLMIEQKTFETHSANIKNKLSLNAKESFINYIEKHHKIDLFRKYYQFLQAEKHFKNDIKKALADESNFNEYTLYYIESTATGRLFADFIKRYFDFFKIKLKISALTESDIPLDLLKNKDSPFLLLSNSNQKLIFKDSYLLCLKDNKIADNTSFKNVFIFDKKHNYFLEFIRFLKELFPHAHIDQYSRIFEHHFLTRQKKSHDYPFLVRFLLNNPKRYFHSLYKKSHNKGKIAINMFILMLILIFLSLYTLFDFSKKHHAHCSFNLPVSSLLIRRLPFLHQIDQKLTPSTVASPSISYVALIGMMGSGKTTLARMYAKRYSGNIIWEINAQSIETIMQSYFQLAYALARTPEEKKDLDVIERIKETTQRTQRLLIFIQNHFKNNKDWLLIFDNVISLKEIEPYLPQNPSLWGSGKVLITTYNANISDSHILDKSQCIFVNSLTQKEALTMFCQIYYRSSPHQLSEKVQNITQTFLNKIPAFPLDVSLAANYLKQTHLSFDQYLEKCYKADEKFNVLQSEIMHENISYGKTRSSLMNMSYEKIIEINPIFKDLLFLVSLLNFKDIPKNLLTHSFDQEVVDAFIRTLKQFSFLSEHTVIEKDHLFSMISLHPCIQEYGKQIFQDQLTEQDFKDSVKKNISILNSYVNTIQKNDYDVLIKLIPHLTTFLDNIESNFKKDSCIKNHYRQAIHRLLGMTHFLASRRLKDAKYHFEQTLILNEKTKMLKDDELLSLYRDLGAIYIDIVDPHRALECVEKGMSICLQMKGSDESKADLYFQKGYIYTLLNKIDKAHQSYEEALTILSTMEKTKSVKDLTAFIEGQQGWLYGVTYLTRDTENKSLKHIEKAFSSIDDAKDYTLKKDISRFVACSYTTLGDIYCKRGEFDKAMKEGFTHARNIVKQGLDNRPHLILKIYIDIGSAECSLRVGKIESAKNLFKDVIDRIYTLMGNDCSLVFSPQVLLMECYLRLSQLDLAEKEFIQLLNFNIIEKTNYTMFMNCLLHYYGAILYKEKNDYQKCYQYFLLFFEKMETFLKSFLDPSEFELLQKEYAFSKPADDVSPDRNLLEWIKKSQHLLKAVYSNIHFYE